MRLDSIIFLITFIAGVSTCAHADTNVPAQPSQNPPPTQTTNKPSLPPTFVDVNVGDQDVIQVANFAADQMGRGSLYQILSAQKQEGDDINYHLKLQVVDAHFKFHNYVAQVTVPRDPTQAWVLTYFSPTNT